MLQRLDYLETFHVSKSLWRLWKLPDFIWIGWEMAYTTDHRRSACGLIRTCVILFTVSDWKYLPFYSTLFAYSVTSTLLSRGSLNIQNWITFDIDNSLNRNHEFDTRYWNIGQLGNHIRLWKDVPNTIIYCISGMSYPFQVVLDFA